ncbi:MAG: FecR domain-containing protein [Bacteroidota bacterium]|nr:FecR domain-containing protein [Bacteroidota bacterium]
MQNNYIDFTENDFINDPFFQDWIINSSEEIDGFWNRFITLHPAKKGTIEAAKRFLKGVSFEEEAPADSYIHQRYLQHLSQVHEKKQASTFRVGVRSIRKFTAVAAVLAIVIIGAYIIFNTTNVRTEKVMVATKFGEIKKVQLPDGSNILLNANSTVIFNNNWSVNIPREVWLKGEAFIEVKHLNNNQTGIKPFERFLVHGEGFTIEVLGTSFDIRQRRGKMEVVLETGKIKMTLKDSSPPITMLPGDIVSYRPATKSLIKSTTVPQDYSAWKERKLLLNNPTLQEITNYLEDNYGKKIVIEDKTIRSKKIEGIIELTNLNDALFIISTVLNTRIERKNNEILIKSR